MRSEMVKLADLGPEIKEDRPRWTRAEIALDYGIWDGDLVIDIGCGPGKPRTKLTKSAFPRADVLVDMNPDLIPVYQGRKFLLSSVEALPFQDDCFDFIWCAHILEHTLDPKKACEELMRIGARGRIKTPSSFKEMLHPLPYHNWLVSWYSNTLIFEKKPTFIASKEWRRVIQSTAVDNWNTAVLFASAKNSSVDLPHRFRETVFDWVGEFRVEVYQ